ncbi:hypothetical protein LUZ60_014206 [Juncus effusus]|nr:hypothetical protein LUZ60_014206 [Juncus effusus]
MAARSKVLAIGGGGNGKRVLSLIRSFAISTKGVHTSAYDKNIDEAIVQPPVVPEEVLGAQPETYWGPNPHTGVFGPIGSSNEAGLTSGVHESVSGESVLDQKVRFRPLEDVEKPVHA